MFQPLLGIVGRIVVGYKNFKVRIVLRYQRWQTIFQVMAAIVTNDNYINQWLFHECQTFMFSALIKFNKLKLNMMYNNIGMETMSLTNHEN